MFRSPLLRRRTRGAAFRYPAGDPPCTIVLSPGFEETRGARFLAPRDLPDSVEALAGTVDELSRIARGRRITVERGVVVFTCADGTRLSEAERDSLWNTFAVPVFEQYLDAANELLATECDAHAGLHIVGRVASREGFLVDQRPCPCGDPRPRLMACEVTPAVSAAFAGA